MLRPYDLSSEEYRTKTPYPVTYNDGALLSEEYAKRLQEEILSIPEEKFDRYDNPFEQKYTLRDKYDYPPLLSELMSYVTSQEYVKYLSDYTGHELENDETRMYWGVHVYRPNDKLDIHVDAGCHPVNEKKKQVTWGLYLSSNWESSYGCELEVWEGDSVLVPGAKLQRMVEKISPMYNRSILFTCYDNAWHGNPIPCSGPENAKRIFITVSFLSKIIEPEQNNRNRYKKAFFIARPDDPEDVKKDQMRILRADPNQCHQIYRNKI